MILIRNILLIVVLLNLFQQIPAQMFADKEFYLVDSLVLEDLTDSDRLLIDKSLSKFHNSSLDTDKILALNDIINNCWTPTAWVFYNEYSNNFANKKVKLNKFTSEEEKNKMFTLLALTQYYKGYTDDVRGNINEALHFYKKGLSTYKSIGDNEGVAMSLNNIGELYFDQGNIIKALKTFHEALDLSEAIDFKEGIASNNMSLGNYYYSQGEFEKALKNCRKSLEINLELGESESIGFCYLGIGSIYEIKKEYSIALDYYLKALTLHEEIGDKLSTARSLSHIAYLKEVTNNTEAIDYYIKSLNIYETVGDDAGVSSCLYYISAINYKNNNLNDALIHGQRSLEIAQDISFPKYIQRSSELLSKVLKKQNKGMQAIEMYELFISTRDSLNNIESQKEVFKAQTKYEYDKLKAIDDAENEKLIALEKEEKEKQQLISSAIAIGLVLTGSFLFFIFNRLKITRKQKSVIEKQKTIVELQKTEVETQRDIAHHQKLVVEEQNKEILESITYAKRIQEAILPPPRLVKEWLTESFIFYKPKDIVAGDFYWMETATYTENNREKTLVYFAAADCTGHGVPGAMVSVVCANALNRAVKEFGLIEPGHVLDKVTQLVNQAFEKSEENIKDGMDIALCALDISAKKVFFSGANNPLYRITTIKEKVDSQYKTETNKTHQLIEYKATKQPIGYHYNIKKFETIAIQLEPGDAIYVFSDGFPDQFGGIKGKKYKYTSFRKSLLANFHHPMETQKKLLETEFENWKEDTEQTDDVCVIGVKINGVERNNFTKRELEVLSHLTEGLPSKLIADKMCISPHTVDTYRRRLLAKTNTYNATELINYCIKKGII